MSLLIDLGKDLNGNLIKYDITDMPHCLISGIAPSGKTVVMDSFIVSLIQNYNHNEVKMIISDFRDNEFHVYDNIPHLLCPIITTPNDFIKKLDYLIDVMNDRFNLLRQSDCYNVKQYNEKEEAMPYIVMFIDEIAMSFENDDYINIINEKLHLILVKGRAVGIHIVFSVISPALYEISGGNMFNLKFRIVLPCNNSLQYFHLLGERIDNLRLNLGEMILKDCTGEMVKANSIYYSRHEIKLICDKIK